MARPDLAAGLVVTGLAAVGGLWFVPANTNPVATAGNDIAPAFMPLLCVGIIAVLGLALLARSVLGRVADPATGDDEAVGDMATTSRQVAGDLAVWALSTVLVLLLLPRVGFVISAGLLLAAWLAYARVRSWLAAAAVVAVVPALLDWLCWTALKVQLP